MADDRLISLNAAIDAFKKNLTVGESKGNYVTICSAIGYKGAKHILESLPTVDAVPVVHGHWIKFGVSDKDGNHQYRCSVCECEEIHSPLVKVSYCWNCGAKMDGKVVQNVSLD